jgi:hypothetical protein
MLTQVALDYFIKDIVSYKKDIDRYGTAGFPLKEEYLVGKLMKSYLVEPDKIETKYIVNVPAPEELSIKNYLEFLAADINYHLIYVFREGINPQNMELLIEKSRAAAGIAMPMEELLEIAEKEENYFRFCLAKEGRIIVEESTLDKAKELSSALMNSLLIKNDLIEYSRNQFEELPTEEPYPPILGLTAYNIQDGSKLYHKHCYGRISDEKARDLAGDPFYIGSISRRFKEQNIIKYDVLECSIDFGIVNTRDKIIDFFFLEPVENILKFNEKEFSVDNLDLRVGLAAQYFGGEGKAFVEGYTIKYNYYCVDKNHRVYNFLVTQKTLEKSKLKLNKIINKYAWHVKNRKWDMPYEYLTRSVTL